MSDVREMLDSLLVLLGNDAALSILFGLVISLGGTQYLKFRVPMPLDWRDEYRWFVRLMSLPLGFFPTYFTWPQQHRVIVALTVALGAPILYKILVAVAYWKWPALEAKLSARPPACDE